MITVTPVAASTRAGYYTGTVAVRQGGREDYYADSAAGRWLGSAAKAWGLSGQPVREEELGRLFQRRHPLDGTRLVQAQRHKGKEPQVAWDITLSDPKPFAALYAVVGRENRKELDGIRAEVIRKVILPYLEELCTTRRGKGGHCVEPAMPIIAAIPHETSREMEPGTHVHLILSAVCLRRDGTTGTILSRPYYQHQGAINALYMCEVARLLEERLGLQVERAGQWYKVQGVPESLCRAWSTRSRQIEEAVGDRALSSAAARETAALATRKPKDQTLSQGELLEKWQAEARRHGFSQAAADKLLGQAAPRRAQERELRQAINAALAKLNETKSHFAEHEILRAVLTEAIGRGISAQKVRAAVREQITQSPEIVRLGVYRGEERFATAAMMRQEKELLAIVDRAKRDGRHALSEKAVEGALQKDRYLNTDQQAAVRQTCLREQTISVITGLPGTGKTRVLASVASAHEKSGREVVGTALAGKAARGLEVATGIRSHTVASLLRDLEATAADNVKHHLLQLGRAALGKSTYKLERVRLTEKSVLVVDEAGMLDTATLRRLLVHAEKARAKVILCGDPDQLQPIGAGAPLRMIAKCLDAANLTQITRQSGENGTWAVESILAIRRGDGEAALKPYAERGLLNIGRDSRATVQKLVEEWKKEGVKKPQDNLIIASQNANVDRINRLAQEARREAGELGGFRVRVGKDYLYLGTPQIKLKDGTRLYQGDRVLFTHTSGTVSNGDLGTVLKIDPVRERLTVQFDGRKKPMTIPYGRYKEHLALGYAITTHRAQGIDCVNVLILAGGSMQDREISFVQASRARNQTRFFASRLEAGKNLEILCRQFGHSRAKNLAHDVIAEATKHMQGQQQRI